MSDTTASFNSTSLIREYFALVKFRLTASVVATSAFGYGLAVQQFHVQMDWAILAWVLLGGFLVVAASNTFNQMYERATDSLMQRTANRPIVTQRVGLSQGFVFGTICAIAGAVILYNFVGGLSAFISMLALLLYVFAYTPLKKLTPFAVFVGAIPGAIPPLSGWVAVSQNLDEAGLSLFLMQFFWQFPHFWSLAWILHEDYGRAGYVMLPTREGKSKRSAFFILVYSLILTAVSVVPVWYGICTPLGGLLASIPGLYVIFRSVKLMQTLDNKEAKQLLYSTLIYTPVVFVIYLLA